MNHEIHETHEKPEELANIVAEYRQDADAMDRGWLYQPTTGYLRRLLDRIEAAWRQERAEIEANALTVGGVVEAARNKSSGDAAAMREALTGLIDGICFHCDLSGDCKGAPCEKMQKAKVALALPRRNCDVGTAEEQAKRLNEWCSGRHCVNCQFKGGWPDECKLQWAQMPYKEGGAK